MKNILKYLTIFTLSSTASLSIAGCNAKETNNESVQPAIELSSVFKIRFVDGNNFNYSPGVQYELIRINKVEGEISVNELVVSEFEYATPSNYGSCKISAFSNSSKFTGSIRITITMIDKYWW